MHATGAQPFDNHVYFPFNEIAREFRFELGFSTQAQYIVALLAMEMRVHLLEIVVVAVEGVFHRVIVQHDPVDNLLLFQRLEGTIKCHPVEQLGKRIFNLVLRQSSIAFQQFAKYKFPATGIF